MARNFFFSALPNVLPLFVLPLSSTAQRCGLEGRAARRSADQSAIRQQSAILHRNRQTLPSTSLSIKSARCRRRRQATRMSPFSTYNEVMIHDHSTALTSFMRVYLPWYVTTHPPASYLPGSHLMLNLHVPSVCCHNTHDSTKYCAVDVILDFLCFTFFLK